MKDWEKVDINWLLVTDTMTNMHSAMLLVPDTKTFRAYQAGLFCMSCSDYYTKRRERSKVGGGKFVFDNRKDAGNLQNCSLIDYYSYFNETYQPPKTVR
jgi:hypothetical protein